MNGRALSCLFAAVAAGAVVAQQDDESVRRCRALAAAQDAGTFGVAAAAAALADADEAVARTAAAIVRHQWCELPDALFAALDQDPQGARMLLRELAQAPRPAAAAWAHRRSAEAPGRSLDERCLALAARGTPLAPTEVDVLLRALLSATAGDGWRSALVVAPPALVDATLGRVHAALQQGELDVDRAGPWLDRLSPDGVRRLLGLVVALPEAMALPLCQRVHERAPELVRERVCAALDGAAPIDPVWLAFAGPCLDTPQRVKKLEQLLAADVPRPTRVLAQGALLDARIVPAQLLDQEFQGDADAGLRPSLAERVLDVAIDRVPAQLLCRWLDEMAEPTAKALLRRQVLEPELERAIVDRLRDTAVAGGRLWQLLATALAQRGSAASLQQVWPLLRASRNWSEYVASLGRRREPFVHELLLTELQTEVADLDADVRKKQLDAVALALVALGDRRELQRLVAAAPGASAGDVRRCSFHASPLDAKSALQLLDALPRVADVEVAAEVLEWAATAVADDTVRERLLSVWNAVDASPRAAELGEVAVRALAASAHRGQFVRQLRTAIAKGPIPDELEPLPYALLGSMPTPPGPDDLPFCLDLLLLAPRTDPGREAAAATRWPEAGFGFPMVSAVAQRLRGVDAATLEAAFGAASKEALADARHTAISRQRLLVLWRELAVVPAAQQAVGVATAELALAIGGEHDHGRGVVHWFAMHAALRRHDTAAARAHAEVAKCSLLFLPEHRRTARIFLGERDPAGGCDPWAALSAMPHVLAWQDATARRDARAATAAAALVREFAGHDASSLATVSTPSPESAR